MAEKILYGKKKFYHKEFTVKDISIKKEIFKVGKQSVKKDNLIVKDSELLKRLKKLRLKIAREKNVPAFVIFSDRTLIEMTNLKPQIKENLLKVNGVGSKKLELYGTRFLNVIKSHIK